MKKTICCFILFAFVACSKEEAKDKKSPVAQSKKTATPAADAKTEATSLQQLLLKQEEPSQRFVVSGTKTSVIKGKKGTVLYIDPKAFVTASGENPGNSIEIELKELLSTNDLLRSAAQTVSDGDLLVSGGSYFIGASSNGKALQIKQGQSLKVEFPKITTENMELFYGEKDSTGTMNWKKSGLAFSSKSAVKQAKKTVSENDTPKIEGPGQEFFTPIVADQVVPVYRDITSSGENVFWNGAWRNAAEAKILAASYTASILKMDSLQKAQIKKLEEDFALEQKLANTTYEAVRLKSLGWINCDRFEFSQKTNVMLHLPAKDSIQIANIFMVFKDIKSVMQQRFFNFDYKSSQAILNNLPLGQEINLVAYYKKNGKVFTFSKNMVVGASQMVDATFTKSTDEEFKNLISSI